VQAVNGREALEGWQASRPDNAYDASPHLGRALRSRVEAFDELEPRLRAFGAVVAGQIDPAVRALEREGPEVDGAEVHFRPEYGEAGRAVWASGITGAPPFEQAALFYVLSYAGEGGHACPVACTAGLVRALRTHASAELRERFLPPLLTHERAAQFVTEAQGGSDVGANIVRAEPDGAAWRITGEKWFCSVADAHQFVVTARPEGASEGTRGIGCFLVPRRVGATPNGFRIRRLKDKLGTRAMATGEIDFDGALAFAIGRPEDGFKIAAGVVLNTSRWLNAVGSTGLMRRAYLEASSFASFRKAFGQRIDEFPLVRENLAVMRVEEHAALLSTLELTALVDSSDPDDVAYHRILVNANKFSTSLAATSVARRGIEALGGNGTIEDFSPLPRLYRDAIVFESWEGTHNVLCAQVARDLTKFGSLELVLDRVRGFDDRIDSALDQLRNGMRKGDPLHFRAQLDRYVRALQASLLLREGEEALAELHLRRHVLRGWNRDEDPDYRGLLDRAFRDERAVELAH
jgi:alkylation response protein AidB-like acyl-CoA dehydrogenase